MLKNKVKSHKFKMSSKLRKEVRSSHISEETPVMGVERRGRQNLNLVTDIRKVLRDRKNEHELRSKSKGLIATDRWTRIALRAQDKETVFQNIHHHINVETLFEAFKAQDGSKAVGVDGVTKKEYAKNLANNLLKLEKRIQNGSYRPRPKREILIPKSNGKMRPIAVACFEDKLVDHVVSKLLTRIFEPLFIENSFGYRPNKSAKGAVEKSYYTLFKNRRKYVLEIDFSNFFNTIPHKRLMRVVKKRIQDERFKRLIGRFLVGEIQYSSGETLPSEIGTPQGSIMSPILANIYLNEVIDQWFSRKHASFDKVMVRYADDAVFMFKTEDDCLEFKKELGKRVTFYGLKLNEDKTRSVFMGKGGRNHFSFLGFTFYWGKQGSRRVLKVKTEKDKLHKAIQEFDVWVKRNRSRYKLKELWDKAQAKIRGHINYFGYQGNQLKLAHFIFKAEGSLYKWLNRRSQKRSYTPESFKERLKHFPLVEKLEDMKLKQLGWNPYAH